jgi:signal transduction histidine kinase
MAWTTSASLLARPSVSDTVATWLKAARFFLAAARRSAQRGQPALFLALSAVSLGILAPLLPTSFLAAVLLMTGISLAMIGAGANLAGTVTSLQKDSSLSQPPAPFPAYESEPPVHAPRHRRPQTLPAPRHDWAELMARINHELRTPLNAVIGFTEVMALEMFGPMGNERYKEYVRHISDSASDLLKSAEDTLALTALLTGPPPTETRVACRLDVAITEAWAFVERKASGRDVYLELAMPDDVEVIAEPRALRQVLANILAEGVMRAAPGGRVRLLAVTDGELVEVVLTVTGEQTASVPRAGSLAICLARTLLEMHGTSLLEIESPGGGWRAVTVLDRAAQPDFFAVRQVVERWKQTVGV